MAPVPHVLIVDDDSADPKEPELTVRSRGHAFAAAVTAVGADP